MSKDNVILQFWKKDLSLFYASETPFKGLLVLFFYY